MLDVVYWYTLIANFILGICTMTITLMSPDVYYDCDNCLWESLIAISSVLFITSTLTVKNKRRNYNNYSFHFTGIRYLIPFYIWMIVAYALKK